MAHLWLRVVLDDGDYFGPGKIELLEAIEEHGSISAAARSMGMAYRHAWELVDAMNQAFREPLVDAESGGKAGGGAALTPWGASLLQRFRKIEERAQRATRRELEILQAKARKQG
jgi:molybdate transport system regulatory protein